jgi:hypothetical protein
VKSLVEDADLPDFQRFHDAFRDDPKAGPEGHMAMAYDATNLEYKPNSGHRRGLRQGPGAGLGS